LSIDWNPSTAFPTPLGQPAGTPTSQDFTVTITSVCQNEIITGPAELEDMEFRILPNESITLGSTKT
jgi:hypothetical protein